MTDESGQEGKVYMYTGVYGAGFGAEGQRADCLCPAVRIYAGRGAVFFRQPELHRELDKCVKINRPERHKVSAREGMPGQEGQFCKQCEVLRIQDSHTGGCG